MQYAYSVYAYYTVNFSKRDNLSKVSLLIVCGIGIPWGNEAHLYNTRRNSRLLYTVWKCPCRELPQNQLATEVFGSFFCKFISEFLILFRRSTNGPKRAFLAMHSSNNSLFYESRANHYFWQPVRCIQKESKRKAREAGAYVPIFGDTSQPARSSWWSRPARYCALDNLDWPATAGKRLWCCCWRLCHGFVS